jgi:hypothetical protein
MPPRKPLFAFAALIAALAGCAHAPWNPYGGWQVVRTKHITLYTDTRFLYTAVLEGLELSYSALAGSLFKRRGIAPVEVVMLEEPATVATVGRYRSGVAVARLPGHSLLGHRGILVLNESVRMPTAAHELAHLFLHAIAPRAPLWVHEAFASYVETIQYRGDSKSQVACLGHLSFSDPLIPLEDLFSWSWTGYDDSGKAAWYRHTARSLFDYFMMAEDGKLREPFARLLAEIDAGKSTKEALAVVFPDLSVAALEQKMVEHRRASEARPRGLCPLPSPIPNSRAADEHKPRVEALDRQSIEELMLNLQMLPRRAGHVDWYPPEVVTLKGGA